MAKNKANNSQRPWKALNEENTKLKRRVKSLEANLDAWKKWAAPISMALSKGDNLRAIALFEGGKRHGTKE